VILQKNYLTFLGKIVIYSFDLHVFLHANRISRRMHLLPLVWVITLITKQKGVIMSMTALRNLFLVVGIIGAMTASVFADTFLNGGFEDGSLADWTKSGGTWKQTPAAPGGVISYNNSGDPGKSAVIHDPLTGGNASVFDANTLGNLAEVLQGDYSARVNNSDPNSHFSTLTQTVSNYTDPNMYFGFAAVLEEPSNVHPEAAAPHFSFSIYDVTASTMLYDIAFNVYNAADSGIAWHNGKVTGGNTWKYSDWNVIRVDTSGLLSGHEFTVSVSAYDCAWGGHGGYAYVDSFQPTEPIPNPGVTMHLIDANNIVAAVPEPTAICLWALGGLALCWYGKCRQSKSAV